jgi:hypothetical protein
MKITEVVLGIPIKGRLNKAVRTDLYDQISLANHFQDIER